MTARLTKARLALLIDAAKQGGGSVKVNLITGDAEVVFGRAANEHAEDPDEVEARRIQELMNSSRETAKR